VVKATARSAVVLALSCAVLLSGCNSKRSGTPPAAGTSPAPSSNQNPNPDPHSSGHGPGLRRPAGPPAIALNAQVRADLTTISVSAHVGSVVIRKEGGAWVMGGESCTVPLARIERALDSLARLHAVPTSEPVPDGTDFQLQITLLTGGKRAIQLDVADRNGDGDLARLDNDSMVRLQGLDRGLWSPNPPDWCRAP
jgi:hypothetical protein